jgi:hypothetical protein
MNTDISFFSNSSATHNTVMDREGFSIYPISETEEALNAFQISTKKSKQLICVEYEIFYHPYSEDGNNIFDMVTFILIK